MTTSSDLRATPIAGSELANLRDLGGLPVAGGRLREGLLLRSDDVSITTTAQAADLIGNGLSTILDLRSPEEATRTGRGPLEQHPARYHHLPLTESIGTPAALTDRMVSANFTAEHVGQWYAQVLLAKSATIVRGLQIIADAPGATIFHCAAGKDRTGIFAACALAPLGAERSTIVADYALTGASLPAIMERLRPILAPLIGDHIADTDGNQTVAARIPDTTGASALMPKAAGALLLAQAASMEEMLNVLDRDHGGILEVLTTAGLDAVVVKRLHDRLVIPA